MTRLPNMSLWYDKFTFINLCSVGPELDKFGTICTRKCWRLEKQTKLETVVRTLNAVFTRASVTKSHVHNMRRNASIRVGSCEAACRQNWTKPATMFATWPFLTLFTINIIHAFYRWSLTSSVFLLSWQLRILGGDWHIAALQKKVSTSSLKEENWSICFVNDC